MADRIFFCVTLVYLFGSPEATPLCLRKKLVIDHDGGADDALAITMSLLYEKYFGGPKVVALTTTFGNVNLTQVIINSDRILALCKRQDIPIYSGARHSLISGTKSDEYYGIDGLGDDGYSPSTPVKVQKETAAVALLELSKKYEGKLIIVAIGPVTNIALAARLDPDFIGRLAQLYIGGGFIYSDEYTYPSFNGHMDPEAYHIVANRSSVDKVTLVPSSQVYETLHISLDWRKNVLGKIQTPIMKAINGFERKSIPKHTSWTIPDPATSAIALDNDIVDEFRTTKNDIILEGKLTVVAIGPVTNIALAARLDPEFIGRLAHLYVGAGHIHTDKHPDPEFNAHMDPEAYHIVANSSSVDKVTFVPFSQVYDTLSIDLDWRINVLGKIQTPIMEALNGFEQLSLLKEPSWTQLDPATTAIALDNDLVDEFRNTSNDIMLEGATRGLNTNDFASTNPNARVVYTANIEKYKKFLIDVYSAELKP